MKVAVIDLTRRDSVEADLVALEGAAARACAAGAGAIVLPAPVWFDTAGVSQADVIARLQPLCPHAQFIGAVDESGAAPTTPLGVTASLAVDDCLDRTVAERLLAAPPDALVLRPASESELQAEAMIERAIALSESVTGLVIVAEADGAASGEPGHGGSVIAVHGDPIAEAVGDDELLIADLPVVPVPAPDARQPLPGLPPILAQRLALHRGERVSVSYPADLS